MSKRKLRVGDTLRIEFAGGLYPLYTMALSTADHGHLLLMLMAEAAREPIPPAPNEGVQGAFDRRALYSRIRGGFSRKSIPLSVRRQVFDRDGRACGYCDAPLSWAAYHCDHVEPVKSGGSDDPSNLRASCKTCNLAKGARSLDDWAVRQ